MIPALIAVAARVGPMLAARGAATGAAGGAAEGGAMSRMAGMAAKMPVPAGGNEPRKPNFDAGKMSGGPDVFSNLPTLPMP